MLIMLALTLLALLGSRCSMATISMHQRQLDSTDIKDKILELQCLARCENSTQKQRCVDDCKLKLLPAPRIGSCPSGAQLARQGRLSCLDSCSHDYDCAEVQKCCAAKCAYICAEPLGVRNATQLPPIPKIVHYKPPRNHRVELTIESSLMPFYFHVEVRSHIGRVFSARKLGAWQPQQVEKISESTKPRSKVMDVFFHIRPGRWYQVRVAAVNAYGFRGYSQPSQPFTLPSNPKPPKAPNDLRILSRQFDSRSMSVKIVWCPSRSNLPVEKYKVIWSLYVNSDEGALETDYDYVKDANHFEIRNLKLNSSYYIQVQAMSISGSKRLKSDKKSLLFNTTLEMQDSYAAPLDCSSHHIRHRYQHSPSAEISTTPAPNMNEVAREMLPAELGSAAYEVRFRLNRKFGMIVQILGLQSYKEKVYELCPQETKCEQREFSAFRVKKDSLEFSKLKYNTRYMLKPIRTSRNSLKEDTRNAFTFTTPQCENFRNRFPKMQIKCND